MKKIAELVANREVYFVRTGQTAQDAAQYMGERNVGAVVVLEKDRNI